MTWKKWVTILMSTLAGAVVVFGIVTAAAHFRHCPRESLGYGNYTNPNYQKWNEALDYAVAAYRLPGRNDGAELYNATKTDGTDCLSDVLCGQTVLTSAADFAVLCETIDAPEGSLLLRGRTGKLRCDEAFFAEQNLLVVDLCAYSEAAAYAYPDELSLHNDRVRMTLRYHLLPTGFEGLIGTLLLVPVPKDCTNAAVDFVSSDDCWLCAARRLIDRVRYRDVLPPLNQAG